MAFAISLTLLYATFGWAVAQIMMGYSMAELASRGFRGVELATRLDYERGQIALNRGRR